MAKDFDREAYLTSLEKAVVEITTALELGNQLSLQDFKRIFFVGCGAPNHSMMIPEYWINRISRSLEVRRYFPAEFIHQSPFLLDENTLVILGSHSGSTIETVQAAQFLSEKPCKTIGISQTLDSPLARAVDFALAYGETDRGYYALYILLQAFVSAFLKNREEWCLHDKIIESLTMFPCALADAMEANEARATDDARIYKDDRFLYVVGAGPMFSTAYVFGVCILMEMQWMHTHPIVAAEFFHGPFEIVDQHTPLVLLVGEDPSRPEAERVVRFCKKYTERLMIYDSADFKMNGIHPEVRPIVAPFILEAALSRFAEHLAVWHNHPLSTRRYMWKTEY
jgi:fructoselysine 6-phosphate deglycase